MLWLNLGDVSHAIVSCNLHQKDENAFQLWVERVNGKNLLVIEDKDREVVEEAKEAIDYAIQNGYKVLEIDWSEEAV